VTGRYTSWAGPLMDMGRFEWERIVRQCQFPMQNTKLVALTIATYADTKTGQNIYPGQKRLAVHTGISERRVRDHLQELERFGLIDLQVKGSSFGRGGKGMASKYHLSTPAGLFTWCNQTAGDDLDLWHLGKPGGGQGSEQQGTLPSGDTDPESEETPDVRDGTPDVAGISPDVHDTNTGRYCPSTSSLPLHESPPHQSNLHPNPFAPTSPNLTHTRTAVDNSSNGAYTGSGMEEERRRQMAALEKLIDQQEKQAS